MKQYIKYGIFIIFTALLYNGAIEAAGFSGTPTDNKTECSVSSQTSIPQQAIHNFYDLLASVSLCLEHVDNTQVPTNKSIFRRVYIYKMQQHAYAPECDRLSYLSPCPMPDANYYVYGLRKIII